ncbi:MAG: hypothetical protein WAU25_06555, partial [Nitrososphaeraceae archaeon]
YTLDKPALRSGRNINPHLHRAASNVNAGKSIVSAPINTVDPEEWLISDNAKKNTVRCCQMYSIS